MHVKQFIRRNDIACLKFKHHFKSLNCRVLYWFPPWHRPAGPPSKSQPADETEGYRRRQTSDQTSSTQAFQSTKWWVSSHQKDCRQTISSYSQELTQSEPPTVAPSTTASERVQTGRWPSSTPLSTALTPTSLCGGAPPEPPLPSLLTTIRRRRMSSTISTTKTFCRTRGCFSRIPFWLATAGPGLTWRDLLRIRLGFLRTGVSRSWNLVVLELKVGTKGKLDCLVLLIMSENSKKYICIIYNSY